MTKEERDAEWAEGYHAGWEEADEYYAPLRAALQEVCQIALGTDLRREAAERIRQLQQF